MTVQLVGYEQAPASCQLSGEQLDWFNKKEQEFKKRIVLEWGGNAQKLRPDSFQASERIRIYDSATSGPVGGEGIPATCQYEQIQYVRPEQRDQGDAAGRRTFPLRQGRGVYRLNPDKMLYTVNRSNTLGFENRDTIAELDEGTIWLRYPLSNFRRFSPDNTRGVPAHANTNQILDIFMAPMFENIFDEKTIKEQMTERQQAARTHFVNHARTHATQRAAGLLQTIQAEEAQVILHERNHARDLKNLREHQKEYDFIEENEGIDESKLTEEYDELLANTKLKKIEFETRGGGGTLQLFTTLCYLHSPDRKERTPAGEFRIDLNVNNNSVAINNLTNKCGGRHHPHIPGEGNPCWGSMSGQLNNLLTQHEMLGFFQLCIDYLESYNPQDAWGRWAANWWIPQRETTTQWLQADGEWLTKSQVEAEEKEGKKRDKKKDSKTAVDDELTRAIQDGTAAQQIATQV